MGLFSSNGLFNGRFHDSMTNTTFFMDPQTQLLLDPPEQPLKRHDSICMENFAHHLTALPTQVLLQPPPLFAQ
jgi:hypothetical protein